MRAHTHISTSIHTDTRIPTLGHVPAHTVPFHVPPMHPFRKAAVLGEVG